MIHKKVDIFILFEMKIGLVVYRGCILGNESN